MSRVRIYPIIALLAASTFVKAAPIVEAKIGKETAWVGEAVPMIITLTSPGPFSGTASFDLPELPRTAIVRTGRPVIGNATVDGDSVFTQTHEFSVFTQQSGRVVIPSFEIRFAGKESFLGEAKELKGTTSELGFQSKRPPDSESLSFIVTATDMQVEQSWAPALPSQLKAGDVIQRQVTMTAAGTTSMMLPPLSLTSIPGVRVYTADPSVEDQSERGQVSAKRTETVRYQFEKPGTYELPTIEIVWWDPAGTTFKSKELKGQTLEVLGPAAQAAKPSSNEPDQKAILPLIVAVVLGAITCVAVWHFVIRKLLDRRSSPEAVSVREIAQACHRNDAKTAYAALLRWRRLHADDPSLSRYSAAALEFETEWNRLTESVFGGDTRNNWDGKQLGSAFQKFRYGCQVPSAHVDHRLILPQLNPTDAPPSG